MQCNKQRKTIWIWVRCGGNGVFQMVVEDKMRKNRNRVWGKSGDGVYHHQLGIED